MSKEVDKAVKNYQAFVKSRNAATTIALLLGDSTFKSAHDAQAALNDAISEIKKSIADKKTESYKGPDFDSEKKIELPIAAFLEKLEEKKRQIDTFFDLARDIDSIKKEGVPNEKWKLERIYEVLGWCEKILASDQIPEALKEKELRLYVEQLKEGLNKKLVDLNKKSVEEIARDLSSVSISGEIDKIRRFKEAKHLGDSSASLKENLQNYENKLQKAVIERLIVDINKIEKLEDLKNLVGTVTKYVSTNSELALPYVTKALQLLVESKQNLPLEDAIREKNLTHALRSLEELKKSYAIVPPEVIAILAGEEKANFQAITSKMLSYENQARDLFLGELANKKILIAQAPTLSEKLRHYIEMKNYITQISTGKVFTLDEKVQAEIKEFDETNSTINALALKDQIEKLGSLDNLSLLEETIILNGQLRSWQYAAGKDAAALFEQFSKTIGSLKNKFRTAEFNKQVLQEMLTIAQSAELMPIEKLAKLDRLIAGINEFSGELPKELKSAYQEYNTQLNQQLATEIVAHSRDLFLKLNLDELRDISKKNPTPTLDALANELNALSVQIVTSILESNDPTLAVRMFERWVEIGSDCLSKNDFYGTRAINAALQNSSVYFLREKCSSEVNDLFASLKTYDDTNYLRRALEIQQEQESPGIVPYVGMFTGDLEFIKRGHEINDKDSDEVKKTKKESFTRQVDLTIEKVASYKKSLATIVEPSVAPRDSNLLITKRTVNLDSARQYVKKSFSNARSLTQNLGLLDKAKVQAAKEGADDVKMHITDKSPYIKNASFLQKMIEFSDDYRAYEESAPDKESLKKIRETLKSKVNKEKLIAAIAEGTLVDYFNQDKSILKFLMNVDNTKLFSTAAEQYKLAALKSTTSSVRDDLSKTTVPQQPKPASLLTRTLTSIPIKIPGVSPKLGQASSAPSKFAATSPALARQADLTATEIKKVEVAVPERTESFNYTIYEDWELYWQLYNAFLLNGVVEKYKAAPSDSLKELYILQQKKMALDKLESESKADPGDKKKAESYGQAFVEFETLRQKIPINNAEFSELRIEAHKKVSEKLQFVVNPNVIAAVDKEMASSNPHNYQTAFQGRIVIVIKQPPKDESIPFDKQEALKTELQLDLNRGQLIRDFSNPTVVQALKDAARGVKDKNHQAVVQQFLLSLDKVAQFANEVREHQETDPVKYAEFIEAKLNENNNFQYLFMLEELGLKLAAIDPEVGKMIVARSQPFNSIASQGRNWIGKYVGHLKNMKQNELSEKFDGFSRQTNYLKQRKEALEQLQELEGGHSLLKTQMPTSDLNKLIITVREMLKPYVEEQNKKPKPAERDELLNKMNQLLDGILKKCAGKQDKKLDAGEIDDIKQMLQIAQSLAFFTSDGRSVSQFVPRQIVELNTVLQRLKTDNQALSEEADNFQKSLDSNLQAAIKSIETPINIASVHELTESLKDDPALQNLESIIKALTSASQNQQTLITALAKATSSEEHAKVLQKAEMAFIDPLRSLITTIEQSKLTIPENVKQDLLISLRTDLEGLIEYVGKMESVANAKMVESRARAGAPGKLPNPAETWAIQKAAPLVPPLFKDFREEHWSIYWKLYDEKKTTAENSFAAHQALAQSLNLSVPEQQIKELDAIANRVKDDYKMVFQRANRPIIVKLPAMWTDHWEYFSKFLAHDQFNNAEKRLETQREAVKRVGYNEQVFNAFIDFIDEADKVAWERSNGDRIKYQEHFESHIKARFNLKSILPEMYKNPNKLGGLATILGDAKDPKNVFTIIIGKYGQQNSETISGFSTLLLELNQLHQDYQKSNKDLSAFEKFSNDLEKYYQKLVQIQFYYKDLEALLTDDPELAEEVKKWDSLVIPAVQVVSSTMPTVEDIIKAYGEIDPQSEELARIKALQNQYKRISDKSNAYQRVIDNIKAIAELPTESNEIKKVNTQLRAAKDVLRQYLLQSDIPLMRDKANQQIGATITTLIQSIAGLSAKEKLDEKQSDALRFFLSELSTMVQISNDINHSSYVLTVTQQQQIIEGFQQISRMEQSHLLLGVRDSLHVLLNHDLEMISKNLAQVEIKSADTIEAKLRNKYKNQTMSVDGIEVNLVTAVKKFNPREALQFVDEGAWDQLKASNPLLLKYSLNEFTKIFADYLKVKAALKPLAMFHYSSDKKEFTYTKDGQQIIVDEREWKELQQKNPQILFISFEKAKEYYAAVNPIIGDYVWVNDKLAKRVVNREPAFIRAVEDSTDPDVITASKIIPLIDLIQTFSQFKLPEKLSSYKMDDLEQVHTLITGSEGKSILVTYDNLKKLLQENDLLDDVLSKQIDAEQAQFLELAKKLETAIAAKKAINTPIESRQEVVTKRAGVLDTITGVFGITRASAPEAAPLQLQSAETLSSAPSTSPPTATSKGFLSIITDFGSSIISRFRGKKVSQPLREATEEEAGEALYQRSTAISPPRSRVLAPKAPRSIVGELPPPAPKSTPVVEDLYSSEGEPVLVTGPEGIAKTQADQKIKSSRLPIEIPAKVSDNFINKLKEEMEFWQPVDQEHINEYMNENIHILNTFNKDELIEVANTHTEVASWLLNYALNIDERYSKKLGEDGVAQLKNRAPMPELARERSDAGVGYQKLDVDQTYILLRAMRDDNHKLYFPGNEFIPMRRFSSVVNSILPAFIRDHKVVERGTIELALIKNNIRVAAPFEVVPPEEYTKKLKNFNASLSVFNNILVVAFHNIFEKLNFTNHYAQLVNIEEDLMSEQKKLEDYKKALGSHLNSQQVESMHLSREDKVKRIELLQDADAKLKTLTSEIKRIEDLRDGFSQGVQKKLQAVREFLPKSPLKIPTATPVPSNASITITPPKPMLAVKEQIYVKARESNEFVLLPKDKQSELITEMYFKVDKHNVTSHIPRKPYDEAALRALAKAMVLKAREAYGKDTPLKLEGTGKILEYAEQELKAIYKSEADEKLTSSARMSVRPKPGSTPSSPAA